LDEAPRRVIDLSHGWTFAGRRVSRGWLAASGDDGELVDLPHCWNEHDAYRSDARARQGYGGYRRSIRSPESDDTGTRWQLVSEGFYGVGDVWLDGKRVAPVEGQYLGFRLDVTDLLRPGTDQRIGVRLDNLYRRGVLPGRKDPDFLLYGGLSGRVVLLGHADVYIDTGSVYVRCDRIGVDRADLEIAFAVVNRGRDVPSGDIRWSIVDPKGSTVDEVVSSSLGKASPGDFVQLSTRLRVDRPLPWSPDSPRLYTAVGRLGDGERTLDVVRIPFGIRRAEFRSGEGFFLNGERLDLHGFNRHESIPGFGNALPPELQRRDAELMKGLGANFVRLSHYPQQPAFLDACDELGLLVFPEIATWKSVRGRGRWLRAARRQMRDLILRDRNRPSVIVWGMGNESRSRRAFQQLQRIARRSDADRPVTYAENHLYRARRQGTVGIPDVWGTNYELDVLADAAAASRLGNVILSECNNHPQSDRGDNVEELRQVAELERGWEAMEGRPYLAGHATWCFADYATEHRQRVRRLAGVLDAWRLPKMAAELFRARYAIDPFVRAFLVRVPVPDDARAESRFRIDVDGPDGPARLHVFSNCERLRVLRDSIEIATLSGAIHYVLPVDEGFDGLTVIGVGRGKTVEDRIVPHGPPARVVAAFESAPRSSRDTVAFGLRVVDARGAWASDWRGAARIRVEGAGRLRSFTPTGDVELRRGLGRGFVCGDGGGGPVALAAEVEGLETGRASCRFPATGPS
jgi:beta-galactosidase